MLQTTYDHLALNATSGSRVLSGLSLAHRRLDVLQRKSLAEDLVAGRRVLTPMTTTQASVVLGVSAFAVFADRYRRKLVACPEPVCTDTTVTDEELDSVIRQAGVARTWDRMAAMIS